MGLTAWTPHGGPGVARPARPWRRGARRREHIDVVDSVMGGGADPTVEPMFSVLATMGARGEAGSKGVGHSAARCSERGRGLGRGC
jgi:hypothetical protein